MSIDDNTMGWLVGWFVVWFGIIQLPKTRMSLCIYDVKANAPSVVGPRIGETPAMNVIFWKKSSDNTNFGLHQLSADSVAEWIIKRLLLP